MQKWIETVIRDRLAALFRSRQRRQPALVLPNTLSGTFELRVDRLVGSVTDGFGTEVDAIWIDIRRQGALLATVTAEPRPQHGNFVFSFDIQKRFTGADLVRETVTLMARDSKGNAGYLRLDGAAQLELIRDHLGAPAVTVLDLDFSRQGNAAPYLGAGWSGAEDDFTWAEDDDSFITFDTPGEPGQYALRLTAGVLLNKPDLGSQQLDISIDGKEIAKIFYTEAFAQFHECRFPHEVFGNSGRSVLHFRHPDAIRPSDIWPSTDRRRLSVNFRRLSIARLLPVV